MSTRETKQNTGQTAAVEPAVTDGVPVTSRPFVRVVSRTTIIAVCLGIAVVCAGAAAWWFVHNRGPEDTGKANAAAQAALQHSLTDDVSRNDNQSIITDAGQLISGKRSGKFTFSNKKLAEYYMYAGAAYLSLKQYNKALTSFKAAPKYDKTETRPALQGELAAGYGAGERQQLIPILQQLADLSQNSGGMSPSAANYQYDIQALQHNQQIDL